jgi:hypothetical protein
MSSLNDHNTWAGNIEDVVGTPIRDSGRPLIDLLRDDNKIYLSGAVKESLPTSPPILAASTTSCTTRTTISSSTIRPPQTALVYFMFKSSRISFKSL